MTRWLNLCTLVCYVIFALPKFYCYLKTLSSLSNSSFIILNNTGPSYQFCNPANRSYCQIMTELVENNLPRTMSTERIHDKKIRRKFSYAKHFALRTIFSATACQAHNSTEPPTTKSLPLCLPGKHPVNLIRLILSGYSHWPSRPSVKQFYFHVCQR